MSFHKDALRNAGEEAVKAIFLFQVVAGALGNALLFSRSVSPVLLGHKQRPAQMVLPHLALANLLVLLSPGVPHTMAAFVSRKPLSNLGCKFVYYIQRVARSTTLCSTCVLTTYQFFTLTPRRAEWVMLRGRAPRVTGPSCCTCWILSLLTYILVPLKITGPQDTHNYTDTWGKWFCSPSAPNAGFVYLWSVSDAVFLTLMVWSSGSMVLLLLRHHQRVQYIHTRTGHHGCPPETRAAHTILMLVVTFVVVYILNSTFCFYITVALEFRLWLIQTSDVLASCFPTVSPFLLLLRDPRTPRICSGVGRNNA
ncbi:vomeronasal type-1 receptor 4-like [Dama dama]|uniref:vomeronasal type-1 receptor 4-like n=1 Tax=Dama dama TaxID=30532 RepID=UPI002A35991C|nr:vomeronasal type-1 receptor 4-like [Dama dama]